MGQGFDTAHAMMQPMQLFTSTLLICWAVSYAQAQRGGAFSTLATPEPTSGSSSSRFAQQQSSIVAVSSSGVATGAPLAETATPSTAGMPKWQFGGDSQLSHGGSFPSSAEAGVTLP